MNERRKSQYIQHFVETLISQPSKCKLKGTKLEGKIICYSGFFLGGGRGFFLFPLIAWGDTKLVG